MNTNNITPSASDSTVFFKGENILGDLDNKGITGASEIFSHYIE